MSLIAVIDYGMGNLKSVAKALQKVGGKVIVTHDSKTIQQADKIVLPGVGAYPQCMSNLKAHGLVDVVKEEIAKGKWFLGICFGFQLLFEESEEFGPSTGFGILKGKVKRFPQSPLKIPHMGWNGLALRHRSPLFEGIPHKSSFYFVHSYYVVPKENEIISGETFYGIPFCSSIQKKNILACQFHPEKSQSLGLKVLENFVHL